jgi:hypothetical protein
MKLPAYVLIIVRAVRPYLKTWLLAMAAKTDSKIDDEIARVVIEALDAI